MSRDDNDWKPHLAELERRRAAARAMGGPERIERLMTQRGKLDARRRLELLFDADSFRELGFSSVSWVPMTNLPSGVLPEAPQPRPVSHSSGVRLELQSSDVSWAMSITSD